MMDEEPAPVTPAAPAVPEPSAAGPAESPAAAGSGPERYGFAPLNAVEARILGALVEKQLTTPEYYPLTLNALTAACNQKNNRAPVVEYDEKTVVRGLDSLREKKLACLVTLAGGRVPKYEHRLGERIHLSGPAELAILCELLLRGPQTAGELRSRADRMHPFPALEAVQQTVDALAARPAPLVLKLPRLPGHKEPRCMHLLAGAPDLPTLSFQEAGAGVAPAAEPARAAVAAEDARLAEMAAELAALRREVAELKAAFDLFKSQFG